MNEIDKLFTDMMTKRTEQKTELSTQIEAL